jgi:hypothetical protein
MALATLGASAVIVGTVGVTAASAGTGQVIVNPSSQNAQTGGTVTMTVTVQNVGQAKPFVNVNYDLDIGPDSTQTGTLTTDANGQTSLTITNNGGSGTDGVLFTWVDNAGTTIDGIGTVTWQPPPPPPPPTPPSITITSPQNGATYFYGQVPTFAYSCAPTDAATITGCSATDQGGNNAPSGQQLGAATGVNPGFYSATVTATDSNGLSSQKSISYNVIPLPQTITFNSSPPTPAVYGGSYTFSVSGGGSGNPVVVTLGQGAGTACSLTGSTVTFSGVGTCQVVANQAGDIDWDAAPTVIQTINVLPAPLSITASSSTSIYGSAIATVTPSYSGFVFNQGPSVFSHAVTCSSAAVQSSNVGTYTNSCSGAVDPDYVFTYTNGTQTINPAPLHVTASSSTILYGQAIPTVTPSYSGFVLNQTPSVLNPQATCSTTANATSDVAVYPNTCSGAKDTNYTISYTAGSTTIKPAPTTLSATPEVISILPTNPYLFTMTTTLTSNVTHKGVPNQTVTFSVVGFPLCTGVTNANGTAICSVLCSAPGLLAALHASLPGLNITGLTCQLLLSIPAVLATLLHNGYQVNFGGVLDYLPSSGGAQLVQALGTLINL